MERVCHSHHMQLLSGCPPLVYWAGSYAWDLLMHSCVCFLAMLIFVIYQDKATTATLQQVMPCSRTCVHTHTCRGFSVIRELLRSQPCSHPLPLEDALSSLAFCPGLLPGHVTLAIDGNRANTGILQQGRGSHTSTPFHCFLRTCSSKPCTLPLWVKSKLKSHTVNIWCPCLASKLF